MKAIYKKLFAAFAATAVLSGCIEDVVPTNSIIQSQLDGNPRATEALVWAMPGHLNTCFEFGSSQNGWDCGYPGLMIIRDLMTEDFCHSQLGANYDHFWYWSKVSIGLGQDYLYPQYPWNFLFQQVNISNKVIATIDPTTNDPDFKMMLVAAYGFRAFTYLDFSRMYEILPTSGYNVTPAMLGLTLPKVTEGMSEEDYKNNPRLTHDQMVEFIESDLKKVVEYADGASARPNKTLPDLGVAYGLFARLYLWDATYQEEINNNSALAATQYAKAKEYADKAIALYPSVTTKEQWLDTSKGFNEPTSAWMFCGQYATEDDAVQARNFSWTGWQSSEKTYGYSSTRLKCFPEIGASIYNRISDRDFRKLTFVAPENSPIAGEVPYVDEALAEEFFTQPYIAVKFRPGNGNTTDGTVGCAVAYPIMRVEEMHFISIECAAHADPNAGVTAITNFMKTYRNKNYFCKASTPEDIIEEIVFQKRVELWGEGQAFFDVKRLNYPVIRAYEGTNFAWGASTFNTSDRPAWMNFVITRQELNNNIGITSDQNAPTPAERYTALKKL